ncbi:hypothetical protein BZG36_04445, partial [Bifiguratus adelaidae]
MSLDLVGKPQFDLLSTTGKTLAKVNKETFTKCKMEGTCLVDGNLLNLSTSNNKFEVVNTKKYPYGIGAAGAPLMPFSSIAVNNLELGTTVFIKELDGYKLPNDNKHNGCVRVDDKGWSLNEEPIDYDGEVELAHFVLLRSVGRGAFGKVRVVQHRNTKSMYALKYINKLKCIKMRAVENIISERRLLEAIDFPFIVNLRYAFQDDENLFMVLDLMLGGDLRFHLERYGKLKEEWVQFYVAEIALSLDYLHSKNIVHRDLKPDNVLLDENGHAHITDFNIAVRYSEKKLPSAVAGSMAYMAPEVLKKKGYTSSVDWWSLGVLAYELVFGKRPFKGKTNDTLSYSIQNDPLEFPDDAHTLVSEECIDCIKALMNRDPTQRLGCGQDGMYRLTAHPWFQDVSWNELARKAVQAPFIPDAKKPNFDATHELEELL